MNKSPNTALVVAAFFSIYVIWGSTYLLNKIAVSELPPFMLASIRFIIAGILIFILSLILGKSLAISKKAIAKHGNRRVPFPCIWKRNSGMGIGICG